MAARSGTSAKAKTSTPSPSDDKAPRARAARRSGGAAAPPATLRFESDWRHEQVGKIVAGGRLVIEYTAERLSQCFATPDDRLPGVVDAHVVFSPRGQHVSGSILRQSFTADVPADATSVAVWFQGADRNGGGAWDSQFGHNYHFVVEG